VARILILGGGCRGRELARATRADGHAVRITTRSEAGRAAIEATGSECWIGTPDRLATIRAALDSVTILCWLMATAQGSPQELAALHGTRLEFLLTQAIDTTIRGVLYEAAAPAQAPPHSAQLLAEGERRARALLALNSIPAVFLTAPPHDRAGWLEQARAGVHSLLGGGAGA